MANSRDNLERHLGYARTLSESTEFRWFLGLVGAARQKSARAALKRTTHDDHEYLIGRINALDDVLDLLETATVTTINDLKAMG